MSFLKKSATVLSSLRINGLGITKAGGGQYNFAAGSYGLIKNIFLILIKSFN